MGAVTGGYLYLEVISDTVDIGERLDIALGIAIMLT